MIYFVAFLIVYFLHVLLKLHWITTVCLLLFAVCMIPLHEKKRKEAYRKIESFFGMSLYLDTILYSFVKEEKVEQALMDTAQTLPKGTMKDLVQKAAEYLQMTFDKTEVLEAALKIIEEEYPCKRLKDVHQFMTHVEYYGGEIELPVGLLLSDKSRWEQRIKKEMERRKKQFADILISVFLSLLICGVMLYLPIMNIDISKQPVVQALSLLVIMANDFVVLKAQGFLCVDWLNIELTQTQDYYVKKMDEYLNYDEKGEKIRSVVFGVIGLIGTVLCFFFANEWVVVLGLLVTLFLFNQHRIGKGLLQRILEKEIKYAFPNWLLDLVLLLQSENVFVALEKSKEHVPGVLKTALFKLTETLEMNPESSEPYHMFLQEFSIPEVHSAMGILYSLSIGNSANADKQVGELIEKNLELLDITETQLLKNSASGMYVLFLLPVLIASFKLVADMLFLMFAFIQLPVL